MILQILHINSIVSPLMDSKLFFKRFVMRNFLCVQFFHWGLAAAFWWKCAFNAAQKLLISSCRLFFCAARTEKGQKHVLICTVECFQCDSAIGEGIEIFRAREGEKIEI